MERNCSNSSNYTIAEQNVTPVVNTYNYAVTASGSQDYVLSGTDRNGSVSGNDPAIYVQVGDTLNFNMNAGGSHPFVIKTVQGTGTGNQVQQVHIQVVEHQHLVLYHGLQLA